MNPIHTAHYTQFEKTMQYRDGIHALSSSQSFILLSLLLILLSLLILSSLLLLLLPVLLPSFYLIH